MKNWGSFLVAAATAGVLLSSSSAGFAATATGELSLTGGNDLNLSAQTITFNFGDPFNIQAETGSFTVLGSGGQVNWRNIGTPISYVSPNLLTGSDLSCGAGCMFVGSNAGRTVTFDLLTQNATTVSGGFVDISGTGLLTLTGFDPTTVSFFLSTQGGTSPRVTFSSTVVSPVPLPGALPLFGSGLATLGLLAMRRKRKAQA